VSLTKPESPVRNQIRTCDMKYWCKHWDVELTHVEAAIGKVGRSATAVRKELTLRGLMNGKTRSADE
jgi:Protein of unknown function (DUF3606)